MKYNIKSIVLILQAAGLFSSLRNQGIFNSLQNYQLTREKIYQSLDSSETIVCQNNKDENGIVKCTYVKHDLKNQETETKTTIEIIYISAVAVALVLTCGFMSGLTVGLSSIDRLGLEIEADLDPSLKPKASRIFNVIDRHHWMLSTLLICNAGAMESLPLVLEMILPDLQVIIVSTASIVVFGEIFPMAMCTSKHKINIAACLSPLVFLLMILTCPISWPIGKILDCIVGNHEVDIIERESSSENESIQKIGLFE